MVDKHDWNCHYTRGNGFKPCSPSFLWLFCSRCCFPAAMLSGLSISESSWYSHPNYAPAPHPIWASSAHWGPGPIQPQGSAMGWAVPQPGRPLVPHLTLPCSSSCPLAAQPGPSLLWALQADQDACCESSSDLGPTGYRSGSPKPT